MDYYRNLSWLWCYLICIRFIYLHSFSSVLCFPESHSAFVTLLFWFALICHSFHIFPSSLSHSITRFLSFLFQLNFLSLSLPPSLSFPRLPSSITRLSSCSLHHYLPSSSSSTLSFSPDPFLFHSSAITPFFFLCVSLFLPPAVAHLSLQSITLRPRFLFHPANTSLLPLVVLLFALNVFVSSVRLSLSLRL